MKKALIILSFLSLSVNVMSQSVGIGTNTPATSAQLDVSSTTKGFLPPRMDTAQRNAIVSPADGLIIFNTTSNGLEIKTGAGWISLTSSTADALPTIQIGTQKWMRNNLDVAYYRNGDPIPQVSDDVTWVGLTTGAWCWYHNDSAVGAAYGKLYNWYAVNDPRGLAPTGWHIPSDAEMGTLSTTLGGDLLAGGKLKEVGTLHWVVPIPGGTGGNNYSGFSALPGGIRNPNASFSDLGNFGSYWSATEFSSGGAWFRTLNYYNDVFYRNGYNKRIGLSVRCLRD